MGTHRARARGFAGIQALRGDEVASAPSGSCTPISMPHAAAHIASNSTLAERHARGAAGRPRAPRATHPRGRRTLHRGRDQHQRQRKGAVKG
eukprot:CAMPEP_0185322722 /NCGR_PEP_ID=MMETSP1363-20130426/60234_1 /TAXON_ID=38817 /ORGANISM="Gephyrocapsa oceanica, Strain RCC1303" /LENGTH=91 /DNA_ID=CAMNT_0027921277 /DNA_START=154 /DNA_END=425 /DNA_ORIENTATION=-